MTTMQTEQADLLERFKACMVLHAVGDAMGYKNGSWEFNYSGPDIHRQLRLLGGLENLKINKQEWRVSDDTVLHLANALCLCDNPSLGTSPQVYVKLVEYYKRAMNDMNGRAPGGTCISAVRALNSSPNGYKLPFNPKGAGCGVSMRSSCIGLRFSKPEEIEDLVAFSIESGRMTHHHPIGYLGGLAAALFTAYSIQNKPIKSWGAQFLKDLERGKEYIKREGYCVNENLTEWDRSVEPWRRYLKVRNIENGQNEPVFPEVYGVQQRDDFYKTVSGFANSWPGALGIDSVLIAYDALLGSSGSWSELCLRGVLHGGDNDSTGSLAASWYGALYGFKNVPKQHYENREYLAALMECGQKLFAISYSGAASTK